jgi:lysophospholipase L1-like esterase
VNAAEIIKQWTDVHGLPGTPSFEEIVDGYPRRVWKDAATIGAAVAARYGAVLVPGGACYDSTFRGPDGLHMSAAGHQVIATRLLPVMRSLLAPAQRQRGAAFSRMSSREAGHRRAHRKVPER